ncbi:putative glucosyltransferase Lgt1 [Legionella donaldsonii]|uniref:Putative glucosyltransferase Lgt1 n=1 Tax=Legionella donaldsonii TaxID=45060 RepID=A0A378IYV9_9GAMM|nr:glycosyltransferase family 88 protein [Legionella donaldsonii]STX40316.1 putative glucosyltransferase Lgt1 [Legionella donaldsonii]
MSYSFNPHHHVKIWLSNNRNSFLNPENQLRLIRMRAVNPNDEINLIYDSSLLSQQASEQLRVFCNKYNITAKDVQRDIIPNSENQEEKDLIAIYQDEISHLSEGGNVAVGSDILRWLKPVYELGTYTDFDVYVDTSEIPPTLSVEKPLLMNLGSITFSSDVESLFLNNDTIAVVDSFAAKDDIKKIQQYLYKAHCRNASPTFEGFISTYISNLKEVFPDFLVPVLVMSDPNCQAANTLKEIGQHQTARQMRHQIIKETADNSVYSRSLLTARGILHTYLSSEEIMRQAATIERNALQQQLGWLNWFLLPTQRYKTMETLVAASDEELLTKSREQTRMALLKTSVVYTSGPGALILAWFNRFLFKRDTINSIALSSFAHYGLEKVFVSKNGLSAFHATAKAAATILGETEIGKRNDLSWLKEGQNATVAREKEMDNAATTFQRFFRGSKARSESNLPRNFKDMREKIETHIRKIEADLAGYLGFYRYHQRHEKIRVLNLILNHFDENAKHFNVRGFKAALDSYCTSDVFASIGKSETKALIDELNSFCQQAECYGLTEATGQIALPITTNIL